MTKEELVAKWSRLLGLQAWKIRLRDEPPPEPARNAALSEYSYPEKDAVLWVNTEADVIHELCHLLLADLDDAFWRAERDKAIDALWKRREERVIKRLERVFLRLSKSR